MNKNIKVFLNEEYGYRTFYWDPQMTKEEFVDWWKSLTDSDIIKYFFNINALPGKIKRVVPSTIGNAKIRMNGDPKDHTPEYYCHFHDVHDSFICVGEEKIPHTRTTRKDWKDYWIDHQIKNQKPEEIMD